MIHKSRLLFLLLMFLSFAVENISAEISPLCKFTEIKAGNELSPTRVSCYAQDKQDVLWMGTWNGLCRFDGQHYQLYRSEPVLGNPLPNNRIVDIAINSNSDIWCVSHNGHLYLFDASSFSFTDVSSALNFPAEVVKNIKAIFPLKKGVTWVVLTDGTCYRFNDKKAIEDYQMFAVPSDVVKGQVVYNIQEDALGNEWILTKKGPSIYHGVINSDYPFSVMREIEGRVFLTSNDGCVAEYHRKTGDVSFIDLPFSCGRIYKSQVVKDTLLALSTRAGLLLYDVHKSTFLAFQESADGQKVRGVSSTYEDAHHRLWVFLRQDALCCLDSTLKTLSWCESPVKVEKNERSNLHLIFEDAYGTLWVKPYNGILSWFDEKSQRLRSYEESLPMGQKDPHLFYNEYFVDHQKNLWLSASQLYQFTFQQKQFAYENLTDENTEIRSLCCDKEGNQWYGDKNGYLYFKKKANGQVYYVSADGNISEQMTRFCNSGVYCIAQDYHGDMWFGTRGEGLFRLTSTATGSRNVYHYTKKDDSSYSLSNNNVYCIYEDEFNRLWVGTYGGGLNLVSFRDDEIRFANKNNDLRNYPNEDFNEVRCITGNGKGVLLVGTTNGLLTFANGFQRAITVKFYRNKQRVNDPHSLAGNDIMSIVCAKNGDVYVCSYALGISKVTSKSLLVDSLCFDTYLNKENPAGDVVVAAKEDNFGRIWLASDRGISSYNQASSDYVFFDLTDFDFEPQFSEASPVLSDGTTMQFATMGGVLAFDTKSIKKNHFSPKLIFTGIKYPGDINMTPLKDTSRLNFASDKRSFSITFSALDFHKSPLQRFAYKLSTGKEWTYTKTPEVNYVNLPSGDFDLMVRSTNHDGIWCDNTRTLHLYIEPTFWETPWRWLVYILLVSLVSGAIAFIYTYIYKLRAKVVMERQMVRMKLHFFTDISHELRTPLTLIMGPLKEVISQENLSKQAHAHLVLAQKNTARMLQLVNQILDFRKIQTHHVRLTLSREDAVSQLKHVMAYYEDMAYEKHITYKLEAPQTPVYIWMDVDKFEKIVFNLLSNAFKYTADGKSITLTLTEDEHNVSVSVKDEGIGIESSRISHIFERFVSLSDESEMQPSSGIGLSLVKELVQLHHAKIDVQSAKEKGSCFIVSFAKDKAEYQQDELVDFLANDSSPVVEVVENTSEVDKTTANNAMPKDIKRKISVLVVEDNAELRQFIVSILDSDYRVREAENGRQGLDIVKRDDIDFIITDIMMPEMDGMEMIRRIKSDRLVCHIPIVVLSAKSSLDDKIEGLENGIDDYLTKPFSATYLRSRVVNLIQQRQMLQQAFLDSCVTENRPLPSSPSEVATTPAGQNPTQGNTQASHPQIEPEAPHVISYDQEFIDQVMAYFEKNMSNTDLAVEDFAEALSMSRTSFYRKLKSIVGLSPVDFIRQIRIKRAVQLINAGEDSMSQVAYRVGFADPKYFSKCFKRDVGVPPLEYKLKQQELRQNESNK